MPWPAEPYSLLVARGTRRHLRALVTCEAVCEELPLVVDGSRRPTQALAEHLQTCLRCQAELSAYRRLLRALRSLRDEPAGAPSPVLVKETLQALGRCRGQPSRGTGRWFAGAVGALGVVLAAAVLAAAARQARAPAGAAV